jgi:very-short-patch-repair endonuclease
MNKQNSSGTPAPADWGEWRKHWRTTIKHTQFEWDFAMDVIPAVIGLQPSQVTPQHPFVGIDGRQYHMDFAIVTEKVKIAIELEGFDKDNSGSGQSKKQHDEFNRRIQSLTALGWKPLTITNAQFKSEPMHYAHLIRQIMLEPNSEKIIVSKRDNTEILESIKKLSGVVRKLDSTSKGNPAITVVHSDSEVLASIKNIGVAGIIIIAALLAALIFALSKSGDTPPSSPEIQSPVSTPIVFKNCAALNSVYPGGVAQSQEAKDKKSYSNPIVDRSVYDANRRLDGNDDGVFCDSK